MAKPRVFVVSINIDSTSLGVTDSRFDFSIYQFGQKKRGYQVQVGKGLLPATNFGIDCGTVNIDA